jgi:hypothetical protein
MINRRPPSCTQTRRTCGRETPAIVSHLHHDLGLPYLRHEVAVPAPLVAPRSSALPKSV